jgi:molybdopterin synthase sulfur carrier subunit
MKIQIKYFGRLTDCTGVKDEVFEVNETLSAASLVDLLVDRYADLAKEEFKVAINQEIKDTKVRLKENDEVALLPPFSGG